MHLVQYERDRGSISLFLAVLTLSQRNYNNTCNLMGHTWPSFSRDHIDLVLVLKTLVFCSHYCSQSSFLDDPMSMLFLTVSFLCICSCCSTLIDVLDWMKNYCGNYIRKKELVNVFNLIFLNCVAMFSNLLYRFFVMLYIPLSIEIMY